MWASGYKSTLPARKAEGGPSKGLSLSQVDRESRRFVTIFFFSGVNYPLLIYRFRGGGEGDGGGAVLEILHSLTGFCVPCKYGRKTCERWR